MDYATFRDDLLPVWARRHRLVKHGWDVQPFDLSVNVAQLSLLNDDGTLYLRDSLDIQPLDRDAVGAWLNGCLRKACDARLAADRRLRNPAP